ncbi:hypothetical protein ACET3Z_030711 [Daucus carota]
MGLLAAERFGIPEVFFLDNKRLWPNSIYAVPPACRKRLFATTRDHLPPPLGLDNRAPFCPLSSDPPLRMLRPFDFDYFMINSIAEFLHYLVADILKIGVCEEADKPKVSAVITTFRRHVDHIWQGIMKRESSKPAQQELFNLQLEWHQFADSVADRLMDSLDDAIRCGSIPLHLYLSTVRVVSCEQFFHRARVMDYRSQTNRSKPLPPKMRYVNPNLCHDF